MVRSKNNEAPKVGFKDIHTTVHFGGGGVKQNLFRN